MNSDCGCRVVEKIRPAPKIVKWNVLGFHNKRTLLIASWNIISTKLGIDASYLTYGIHARVRHMAFLLDIYAWFLLFLILCYKQINIHLISINLFFYTQARSLFHIYIARLIITIVTMCIPNFFYLCFEIAQTCIFPMSVLQVVIMGKIFTSFSLFHKTLKAR